MAAIPVSRPEDVLLFVVRELEHAGRPVAPGYEVPLDALFEDVAQGDASVELNTHIDAAHYHLGWIKLPHAGRDAQLTAAGASRARQLHLPPADRERAQRAVAGVIAERHEPFSRDLRLIQNNHTRRGTLSSSMFAQDVQAKAREELRTRALAAWRVYEQMLAARAMEVGDAFASELNAAIFGAVDAGSDDVRAAVNRSGLDSNRERSLAEVFDAGRRALQNALDLAVLVPPTTVTNVQSDTHLNVFGPVTSLQTGAGSTAHISTPAPDYAQFRESLQALVDALSMATETNAEAVAAVREIALEAIESSKQPTPNPSKLKATLFGLATLVQTLGSAGQAGTLLKAAATALGFPSA